ncbi:MAG TPA: tetratricopeptide repeat protein, partial [Myxococcales bacterium]|nr:tetratricopeptide repeat protein [Myxococcales bacterium]
ALGLPAIRACGDTSALLDRVPLPSEPQARAALNALSERMSEVNALRLAGRYAEVLRRLEPLEQEAGKLGYRPLEAEVLYQKGLALDRSGKPADAVRALVEASYAAEAGRDDALKVSVASRLTFVSGRLERFEEGEHWARVGRAALERGGGNPAAEGALLNDLGSLRLAEGKNEEALAAYERSVRLLTGALGPEHLQTLNAVTNLAALHSRGDHPEEAVRLLEQAIPAIERLRGSSHPTLYSAWWTQAFSLQRLRRFPEAHAAAARALAVARLSLGQDHPKVGSALDLEATILQEEGRFREALATYRQSLEVKQRKLPPTDPELAHSYDGIGQSLLGLRQWAEAVEPLETALKLRGPEPGPRAETQFALARALWLGGKEKERAEALARQAQADFEKARQPDQGSVVAAWLRSPAARAP